MIVSLGRRAGKQSGGVVPHATKPLAKGERRAASWVKGIGQVCPAPSKHKPLGRILYGRPRTGWASSVERVIDAVTRVTAIASTGA